MRMHDLFKRVWFPVAGTVLVLALYLVAPPPKPALAQFVDQSTWGGTAGGTANAVTINIPNYTSHTAGVVLRFIPSNTNTGPTTINVSSLGAVAVQRPSSINNVAFSSNEFVAGELTCVVYNGTVYQLACNTDVTPIGKTVEYRGAAVPRGVLVEDGAAVSRTTYAALFSVIGTTYGVGDGASTFNVPNSLGTVFAALDGGTGRLNASSGCSTSVVSTICGAQTVTLLAANLPPYTPSGTITNGAILFNGVYPASVAGAPNNGIVTGPQLTAVSFANILNVTQNTSTFAGTPTTGTSTPYSNVMPTLIGRRGIKY